MGQILFDLQEEFQAVFGTRPHIGKIADQPADPSVYTIAKPQGSESVEPGYSGIKANNLQLHSNKGYTLQTTDAFGVEIWLPVWLYNLPAGIVPGGNRLFLPYTVVKITGSSNVIKTPLLERKGTVKELFSIDDYKITIKGFLIDKEQRLWPEKDLETLKKLNECGEAFSIDNALVNIFLQDPNASENEQQRVIMTGFDLPEIDGGRRHARPFVMQLESDSVFTLEVV